MLDDSSTTDAYRLTSRPSASRKLYLDFDGHVTTDTAWNNSSRQTISSEAWDLDGAPGTWSPEE